MTLNRTILLIGNSSRLKNLSFTLQKIGYEILSADDGRAGFRLMRRCAPDLIIADAALKLITADLLCSMIRADREMRAMPILFLSTSTEENIKLLRAGADDILADVSDSSYLASKIEWLIERKSDEKRLVNEYKLLCRRQSSITQIIKETTELFDGADEEFADGENNLGKKIEFGMNMLAALANLLEEQANAFKKWERSRRSEKSICPRPAATITGEPEYECVTYDLTDGAASSY